MVRNVRRKNLVRPKLTIKYGTVKKITRQIFDTTKNNIGGAYSNGH